MIRKLFLLLFITASFKSFARNDAYNNQVLAYIDTYKSLAIDEQQRSGVPAAITLAQGIHETMAGQSELATIANNHFGIKCKKEWTGETFAHDDDAPQECFRKYGKAADSYKDHSDYLKASKRYASCFLLSPTDYALWAAELRKCGYATNPQYAQNLIKIIEDFHLQQYTYAALGKAEGLVLANAGNTAEAIIMTEHPAEIIPGDDTGKLAHTAIPKAWGKVTEQAGVKGIWVRKGEVLLEYAIQNNIRYAKLLELNALPDAPLADDRFVYLEKGGIAPALTNNAAPVPVTPALPVANTSSISDAYIATVRAADVPKIIPEQLIAKQSELPVQGAIAAKEEEKTTASQSTGMVVTEEAPKDAFSRMKAEMDKAVYAREHKPMAVLASPVSPVEISKNAKMPVGVTYHTVASGETAFGISKRYGVSMKQLMEWNNLDFSAIKIGQKLRVK